jgi:uncharacterized membrane protein YoaK (UPF0700 family)
MTDGSSRTAKQTLLAVALCVVAGYLDGYGLLIFNTYVSFMSGNSTFASVRLGQGAFHAALPAAVAVLFFVAGSTLGALLLRSKLPHTHQLSFAFIGLLIAIVFVLTRGESAHITLAVALLSLGMGTVNAILPKIGAESVSLTFMTGNLNRIGGHLAGAICRESLADARSPNESHLTRARVELSVWLSFVTGAIVAGVFVSTLRTWALVPPLTAMAVLTVVSQTEAPPARDSALSNQC